MTETCWNGEPCTARRITAVVADNTAFPQYWARHLVGTRRNILEVTHEGTTFYLDDEDGSAWRKVTNGGAPHHNHSAITIDTTTIELRADHDEERDARHHTMRLLAARATSTALTPQDGHLLREAIDQEIHEAETARTDAQRWLAFIERGLDTHMQFSVRQPDGTFEQLPCADWCQACRVETAESHLAAIAALYKRWVKGGPPRLGTSLSRWWDTRLAELHRALPEHEPSKEQTL